MKEQAPNILLITSDQQHHSTLGAVNPRIRTPALDRLCREGTRFDRAYCPNPTCTPTRASIITGMYPSQHGAWSLGTKLFDDVPTLGGLLSEAGYATSLIGKAHFQPLASAPAMESLECQPTLRDLDFWRGFHGPWYGFQHIELARNHVNESHAGQHYALWMEEMGLTNWRDYFVEWPPKPDARANRHYYESRERSWALPERFHYTRWTGERTRAMLRDTAGAGRPFLCWSSYHDPHPPYMVPDPWDRMYDPADMQPGSAVPGEHDRNPLQHRLSQLDAPDFSVYRDDMGVHGAHSHLFDPEEMKRDMAVYYGMVSFMDEEIGRTLDELDRLGLAGNTLVVFTTDHGHFLGQHGLIAKCLHHYEDLLRLPFVVRWPGRTPAGRTSPSIQNLVDLAPSFLRAAGIEPPGVVTGVDQIATWCGGPPARSWSITENRHTRTKVHMRTFVEDRYKLTVYRDGGEGEFYDLDTDPSELCNLWDEPGAAPAKAQVMQRFLQACLQSEPTRMPRIASA